MGRDANMPAYKRKKENFNSHARVGRDAIAKAFFDVMEISTHTPAWGVTSKSATVFENSTFQLTRPRGA